MYHDNGVKWRTGNYRHYWLCITTTVYSDVPETTDTIDFVSRQRCTVTYRKLHTLLISSQTYWSKVHLCTSYTFWKKYSIESCCFFLWRKVIVNLKKKKNGIFYRTIFYSILNISSCRKPDIHYDLLKITKITKNKQLSKILNYVISSCFNNYSIDRNPSVFRQGNTCAIGCAKKTSENAFKTKFINISSYAC